MDSGPLNRLACVMVGLPARGKTYTARKVARYLNWLGHRSRIFNVGNYRRKAVGAHQRSDFFDPSNEECTAQRNLLAQHALTDMLDWLKQGGDDLECISTPVVTLKRRSCSVTGAGVGGPSCIALYDATNSTFERREGIMKECKLAGVKVFFIENICDDVDVIMNNIREVKLSSPDYAGIKESEAIEDFQKRIDHYKSSYETIIPAENNSMIAFVKVFNIGEQIIVHNVNGYLESRIVYFLMNLNTAAKSFFISRHGESIFNTEGKIGGDSYLSAQGEIFAEKLPRIIDGLVYGQKVNIWTSTLKRTIQTASQLLHPKLQWKQLDELSSGSCDGLTYEEIEEKCPLDFAERDLDKFNYRYHGGESYRDLVHRLEPVILELERHNESDTNIYIVGHQAVVRAIYAYFHGISHEDLPYIKVPLHTIIKLTPKAYNCLEERVSVDVPAVDTFRPKLTH